MSFEADQISHYKGVRERLMGLTIRPKRIAIPAPREEFDSLPARIIVDPETAGIPHPSTIESAPPKPTPERMAELLDAEDERDWREGVSDILKSFGENRKRLVSHQRDVHIVACRAAVAQYLRNRGWSFPRIGTFMGRDHSSIVNLLNPEGKRRQYVKVREVTAAAYREHDRRMAAATDDQDPILGLNGKPVGKERSGDDEEGG